jgi:MFS family permease
LPNLRLSPDNTRLFVAMVLNEGGFAMYVSFISIYIAALGASPREIGLVLSSRGVMSLVLMLVVGHFAERLPQRGLIVAGRSLFVLALLVIGVATTWWMVIPGLLLFAASNTVWPAIQRVIASGAHDGEERLRAFTLINTVGPALAFSVTPALAGYVADATSIRVVYFLAAVLAFAAVAMFSTVKPPAAAIEENLPQVSYRLVLAQPGVLRLCLLTLATMTTFLVGSMLAPNYLKETHAISVSQIGLLSSIGAAGAIIGSLLMSRAGLFRRLRVVYLVGVVSMGGMFSILLFGHAFWQFSIGYLIWGLCLFWPLIYAAFSERVPDHLRARAFVLTECCFFLAFAIAPFIAGFLYAVDPRAPQVAGLLALPPIFLLAWFILRPATVPATEPEFRDVSGEVLGGEEAVG